MVLEDRPPLIRMIAVPTAPLAAVAWPLALTAEPIRYAVSATWEEGNDGHLTETKVTRQVVLQDMPQSDLHQVRLLTQQMALPEAYIPQPLPLQRMALQLSALYSELELVLSPIGEPIALLNYAHIARTWEILEAELRQAYHADDTIAQTLLRQVEQQIQDPGRVLESLHHDYAYRALLHTLGRSAAPASAATAQPVEFSQFFDGQSIWFSEYLRVKPTELPTQVTRTFRGVLDEHRTDLTGLQQRIQDLLHPRPPAQASATDSPSLALSPGGLHCGYEAVHTVSAATGLADKVVLTVYCRFAERYNKQYSLTIQRL